VSYFIEHTILYIILKIITLCCIQLTSILKDFEESFRLSNVVATTDNESSVMLERHSTPICPDSNDADVLEEIELPPGDIADCSIGDFANGSCLQVDNFVDDESFSSPIKRKDLNADASDIEDEHENTAYIPSFGGVSSTHTANPSPNLANNDPQVNHNETFLSETKTFGVNINYSLEEMCQLLKEESDSDVESIITEDELRSGPVPLQLPIQNMDVSEESEVQTSIHVVADCRVFCDCITHCCISLPLYCILLIEYIVCALQL
jgi:hypothetical protein